MADTITAELLHEINRVGSNRESIALIYRRGIEACHAVSEIVAVDWNAVNAELLRRYKPSGLNYIKALAWSTARVRRLELKRGEVIHMAHEGGTEEEGKGSTEGQGADTIADKPEDGGTQKPAPDGD